ncbi:MAG: ATP-binding protein [Elusimicrobiota bacterium]
MIDKFAAELAALPAGSDMKVFIVKMLKEFTEAENEAKKAAVEWQVTFDSVSDGIFLLDKEQRILQANRAIADMFGMKLSEIIGKRCWEFVHGTDKPIPECPILRMNKSLVRESCALSLNNHVIEGTVDPILDTQGNIIGSVHFVHDITKQRQTEEALKSSETNYRNLFEDSPISLWEEDFSKTKEYLDSIGNSGIGDWRIYFDKHPEVLKRCAELAKVTNLNKTTLKILECDKKEDLLKNLSEIFREDTYPVFQEELVSLLENNFMFMTEVLQHTFKDKIRYVVLRLTVMPGCENSWSRVLLSLNDITELKETEKNFLHSQKMAAIGRLAGGIAHDFNNLLNIVMGFSDLILNASDKEGQVFKDAEEIKKAAVKASTLTAQLLTFSRKQPLFQTPVCLNDILKNMEKMLRRTIGEDIELMITPDPILNNVFADRGHQEQAILNIVVNAKDAMPNGGKLTISTENVSITEKDSSLIAGARPGEFALLSIKDTGIGMNEETIKQIFEPFYTTKLASGGTGLGLPAAFGIVEQHGGWINVESRPGEGSEFRIYMPVYKEGNGLKAAPELLLNGNVKGKKERILLVEDEQGILGLSKRVLEGNNYVVFGAVNVEEAMNVFNRENGDFRLLFTDSVLPDGNGVELAKKILSINPDIRILVSSGYLDDKAKLPDIRNMGFHFLPKPYGVEDLLKAVRKVLAS